MKNDHCQTTKRKFSYAALMDLARNFLVSLSLTGVVFCLRFSFSLQCFLVFFVQERRMCGSMCIFIYKKGMCTDVFIVPFFSSSGFNVTSTLLSKYNSCKELVALFYLLWNNDALSVFEAPFSTLKKICTCVACYTLWTRWEEQKSIKTTGVGYVRKREITTVVHGYIICGAVEEKKIDGKRRVKWRRVEIRANIEGQSEKVKYVRE